MPKLMFISRPSQSQIQDFPKEAATSCEVPSRRDSVGGGFLGYPPAHPLNRPLQVTIKEYPLRQLCSVLRFANGCSLGRVWLTRFLTGQVDACVNLPRDAPAHGESSCRELPRTV